MKRKKRKHYRYILSGGIKPSDPISNYRLIANRIYASFDCIRICVDDIKLQKWDCDSYSTTNDKRTLKEIGFDLYVNIGYKWVLRNDLIPENPDKPLNVTKKMEAAGYRIGGSTWQIEKEYRKWWSR